MELMNQFVTVYTNKTAAIVVKLSDNILDPGCRGFIIHQRWFSSRIKKKVLEHYMLTGQMFLL
jgi:hypothetical protein